MAASESSRDRHAKRCVDAKEQDTFRIISLRVADAGVSRARAKEVLAKNKTRQPGITGWARVKGTYDNTIEDVM